MSKDFYILNDKPVEISSFHKYLKSTIVINKIPLKKN